MLYAFNLVLHIAKLIFSLHWGFTIIIWVTYGVSNKLTSFLELKYFS